jgi:PKD repeat protein
VAPLGTAGVSVRYEWVLLSGPETPALVASGTRVEFAAQAPGVYRIELRGHLVDGAGQPVATPLTGADGTFSRIISLEVAELPPIADGGSSFDGVGTSVPLDGTGSYDPNGGPVTHAWTARTEGGAALPASAFGDPTAAATCFTPGAPGRYEVTLTVTKAGGLQAQDTVPVSLSSLEDLRPTAAAGPDRVVWSDSLVSLDGSGSRDPQGTPITYAWKVLSSPAVVQLADATTPHPSFTPIVEGNYELELTVSDGALSHADTMRLLVEEESPRVPKHGPAAVVRVEGLTYGAFFWEEPPDLGAFEPVVYLADGAWRPVLVVDLAESAAADPAPEDTAGLFPIRLIGTKEVFATLYVSWLVGEEDFDYLVLSAVGGTGAEALSTEIVGYGVGGRSLTLDGTESHDDVEEYLWVQADGPHLFDTRADGRVTIVPHGTGLYEFVLVVTDAAGLASFPAFVSIPVVPAANLTAGPPEVRLALAGGGTTASVRRVGTAPTVAAAATTTTATAAQEVFLIGTVGRALQVSAAQSRSRNGGALTFQWRQQAGTPTAWLADGTGAFAFTPSVEDTFAFELTVTDENGVSGRGTLWVTAVAAGRVAPVARVVAIPPQTLAAGEVLALTLDGSASSGAGLQRFIWSQRAGVPTVVVQEESAAPTATIALREGGRYTFELRVADERLASAPTTVSFAAAAPAGVGPSGTGRGPVKLEQSGCHAAPDGAAAGAVALLPLLLLLLFLALWRSWTAV